MGQENAVLWMPAEPVSGKVFKQIGDEYSQVQETGVTVNLNTGLGPYPGSVKMLDKYYYIDQS